MTHYEVLGVPRLADGAQIARAYRRLAKRLHPDTSSAPGTREPFERATWAYQVLTDPRLRSDYDKTLALAEPRTIALRAGRPDVRIGGMFGVLFAMTAVDIALALVTVLAVR